MRFLMCIFDFFYIKTLNTVISEPKTEYHCHPKKQPTVYLMPFLKQPVY